MSTRRRGEGAGTAKDVHAIVVDGRRRARAHFPLDAGVVGLPFLDPQHRAGRLVESHRPFSAAHSVGRLPVGREHAPVGYRRPGETRLDRHSPAHLQPLGRKRLDQTRLAPFAQPAFAAELRPVVGADLRRSAREHRQAADHCRLPRLHGVSLAALSGPPTRGRSLRRSPAPVPCRSRRSAPAVPDSRPPRRRCGRHRRRPARPQGSPG